MVRITASLERKLQKLFPRVRERDKFIIDAIESALSDVSIDVDQPESIGGTLHLFTDGGSRGNPGHAAIGCVLEDPQKGEIIREHYEYIGEETNNVAEYRAVIEGLKIAKRYHPNRLISYMDSQLIERQLNGQYRVKMPALKKYFEEIQELRLSFPSIEFIHIPRGDNFKADALVNKALDAHAAPSRNVK
ncbi:ribonuclease HI family protein [Candidatus Peregrinibacteria bacterium]|nr:ribonuclease HI family protein [Candidatus Peregrinibacteria bacterium]MBT3598712.1 ribonuclease HI family protein [Candidatus Peregrinibacteria bacterium]MBT4586060.1 ribonuclease HI family protein [Candidatus Peregrinibacteria bacterium]MBT6731278.1 ribonuclease HI family protein [Candidatus Peregrinibacteria bacterium]MBT7008856.1 ribonuclease HI family protein [Candidatus Peregrinibacteria bacterium]